MELLNKMLNWIKAHKKKTICFVALAFFAPILLVYILYSLPIDIPFFSFPLSAGDLLGYYAAFIAAVGTVFLGFVALWQNQELNRKDKEAKENLEKQKKEAIKPKIKCDRIYRSSELSLVVDLSNNQKNEACNICVEDAFFFSNPDKKMPSELVLDKIILSLKANDEKQLTFSTQFYDFSYYINLTICYDDTDNNTYRLHIEASYIFPHTRDEWEINKMEYLTC